MFGYKESNRKLKIDMWQLATSLQLVIGDQICNKVQWRQSGLHGINCCNNDCLTWNLVGIKVLRDDEMAFGNLEDGTKAL
jgi:hypothetical protein